MTRTKSFPDPRLRRRHPPMGEGMVYATTSAQLLDKPEALMLPALDVVLDRRQSHREMAPPSLADLGHLLWLADRVRQWQDAWPGPLQTRPTPAAGGLHALDLLVSRLPYLPGLHLYEPFSHSLLRVDPIRQKVLDAYHEQVEILFPQSRGCILTLLADHGKLNAKYLNWETLALRDAGAILATLGICAAGIGMGYCIGGILGNELIAADVFPEGHRVPVGCAIFGSI